MASNEFPHSSPDSMQRDVAAQRRGAESSGVTPDTKMSKDETNYRPAGSSNTRCERCAHFEWSRGGRGTGTCELVAGMIRGDYVCDEYSGAGPGLVDLITGEPTR